MLRTLGSRDVPLADREGFERSHRSLMRAVEAVMSSIRRPVTVAPRLQPFRRVIAPLVKLLVSWILQSQTRTTTQEVRQLYEVLQSASIARRRLWLAFGVPLAELYRSIGSAGQPERDQCYLIAMLGLLFFAIAAVVVPGGLYLLLRI